jgi:competence protein ComEA
MPAITFTRRQALVLAALALAGVLAAAHFLGGHAPPAARSAASTSDVPPLTTPSPSVSPAAIATTAASVLVVDVAGAVFRPGLYRLPPGSRVADAIARAGGETRHALAALVNLAAPVADGEQVLVPSSAGGGSAASGAVAAGGAPSPTAPVDLNTATAEQLDTLPGVGPVTAQKIVDYRTEHGPFTSVDDLDAIPGIGPAKIDDLRGLVIT